MSSMTQPADERWTVRRVLEWTTQHFQQRGCETPRLDAEILLAHVRGCPRIQLYTRYDEEVTEEQRARMRSLVKRRAEHEPVAYLVGKREFFGLDFAVTPDVLVPRPDTETLVVELLAFLKGRPAPRVLELGTGSGCIAVATAVNATEAQITAVDVSDAALAVARRNAAEHGVADRIEFLTGDLFTPVPAEAQFDAVVSNPPYVRTGELAGLSPDVRLHEPVLALDGGVEGLDFAERIIFSVGKSLKSGGFLAIELSPSLMPKTRAMLEAAGCFEEIRIIRDAAGKERVIAARRRGG